MTDDDRRRWDGVYAAGPGPQPAGGPGPAPGPQPAPPEVFAPHARWFPRTGRALELACGTGGAAVWLAERGLDVLGVDVSPVAVARARDLAAARGVAGRCRFEVFDLDGGLPPGPPADVILCHMFRDPRLDGAVTARLVPGGLLAVATLSEVGAGPGPFRAAPGELDRAFGALEILASGEGHGRAWLLGRNPEGTHHPEGTHRPEGARQRGRGPAAPR